MRCSSSAFRLLRGVPSRVPSRVPCGIGDVPMLWRASSPRSLSGPSRPLKAVNGEVPASSRSNAKPCGVEAAGLVALAT